MLTSAHLLPNQARLDKERYQRALSEYQQQQAAEEPVPRPGEGAHQDPGLLPLSPTGAPRCPARESSAENTVTTFGSDFDSHAKAGCMLMERGVCIRMLWAASTCTRGGLQDC